MRGRTRIKRMKRMEIQLINDELLSELHGKAAGSVRLRQNFDLRTTPEDGSQRMLNVLEVGTHVPIHRHTKTSETVICLEGCFDEVFYEELPTVDCGGPVHDGTTVNDSLFTVNGSCVEAYFKEVARFRICPREGRYGIQIPKMAWHTIDVKEPSTIFEAKDGRYGG